MQTGGANPTDIFGPNILSPNSGFSGAAGARSGVFKNVATNNIFGNW